MEQNPLVSVVIPTYNRAHYLGEAIDSVLQQTYPHYEIIVIDDGSKDNTPEVVAKYGSRVISVRKENGGLARARNAALSHVKGELVCFLDDDDRWVPEKLEKQVACFQEDPALDLCYSASVTFMEGEEVRIEDGFIGEKADFHTVLNHEFPPIMTLMVRTSVMQELNGFDTTVPGVEDWDLELKLFAGYKVRGIRERLVEIRNHRNNMSKNLEKFIPISMRVLQNNLHHHGDCAECRRISGNINRWMRDRLFNTRRDQAIEAYRSRAWGEGTRCYLRAVGALTISQQMNWLGSKLLPKSKQRV